MNLICSNLLRRGWIHQAGPFGCWTHLDLDNSGCFSYTDPELSLPSPLFWRVIPITSAARGCALKPGRGFTTCPSSLVPFLSPSFFLSVLEPLLRCFVHAQGDMYHSVRHQALFMHRGTCTILWGIRLWHQHRQKFLLAWPLCLGSHACFHLPFLLEHLI